MLKQTNNENTNYGLAARTWSKNPAISCLTTVRFLESKFRHNPTWVSVKVIESRT